MERTLICIFLIIFIVGIKNSTAQFVQKDEAAIIAENWIKIIKDKYGHWENYQNILVEDGLDLKYKDKIIGYYFPVSPKGYVVINLRKELIPVEAFCDKTDLKPNSDKGLSDLIKFRAFKNINYLEKNLGPITDISSSDILNFINVDYRENWDFIENYSPGMIQKNISTEENYQDGDILLSTLWDQEFPYNDDCPDLGCTTTVNGRALVGCVATAGAQIMKYWNWPPFGEGTPYNDAYNWINMPLDSISTTTSTQINAVAELSQEIGNAVSMNYGCDESGTHTSYMVGVFENQYRYHNDCNRQNRSDYTASTWFIAIQNQLNVNRPIQYKIEGHSIVCDGWLEGGIPLTPYIHTNYGWGEESTAWFSIDNLYMGNPDEEYIIVNIKPEVSLNSFLSGTYSIQSLNYRYFDRDATGTLAIFNPGQLLQTLPGITITGNGGGTGNYVSFNGANMLPIKIFTNGDPAKGVEIREGSIRLSNGGSIKLQ